MPKPTRGIIGGGHSYAKTISGTSWTLAEAEAVSLGGHLVTINSQAENDFLANTHDLTPSGYARFIGFYQGAGHSEPAGGWIWISGESVTYTNWATGEPNEYSGGTTADWARIDLNALWSDARNGAAGFNYKGIIELPYVPIPSAVWFLGSGLIGIVGIRRKFKK